VTCRLVTARELADTLGVSAETVLRWTRRGDLPAIRLPGGAIRYRESDLDAWLASRETGEPARGVSPTQAGRARASVRSLPSHLSPTPPPDAATTEEDF
jgi:excisionase family DNA binding protein